MAEITSYAAGSPSWVDLMTSDPEAARAFYRELFGWELEVGPAETGHYTIARLRGHSVAGLGGEPARDGMPTAWTTYLASDDVDATVGRITEAGGQLLMEPLDVMDQGRMAIAADPTGAVFGLWQAGEHAGATLVNEPGTVSWNQLETRDLDAARRFYTAVFGYRWEDVDTGQGGPPYATFAVQDRPVGGALQMDDNWPAEIPAHWMAYFAVADTDQAVATVQRLGGSVQMPGMDSPYGRFAVVSDPQGGVFTVIRLPDRAP
jgi:predicted enzyme related to lactoylglutathione lyase